MPGSRPDVSLKDGVVEHMQWFMVLGAGEFQLPLIRAAKARGLLVAAVSIPGDYPGFAEADARVLCDVRDKEAVLKAAREYGICGIATDQTDIPVPTAAYVAARLGLPGMSEETALNFTDKARMRALCERAGLPTIPSRQVGSLEQARAFLRRLGAPAILKPVDNQGSRGVCRVASEEELAEKFSQAMAYSQKKEVILEKFICGRELEVDSMVIGGQVTVLATGDIRLFTSLPGTFSAYLRSYPSQQAPALCARLEEVNRLTVQALGMKQGITHGEYIAAEDGEIYLIEIAARGGGNFIASHIVPHQSGLNNEELILEMALHHHIRRPALKPAEGAVCYLSFYLPEGRVEAVEGVAALDADPDVLVHSLHRVRVGMQCRKNLDKTSRFTIVLKAPSAPALERKIAWARRTVEIRVRCGGRLAGPIWQ